MALNFDFSDIGNLSSGAAEAFSPGGGQWDWLSQGLGNIGAGGQFDWLNTGLQSLGDVGGGVNFNDILKGIGGVGTAFKPIADIGETGFDVYNSIERQKQMADYTKAVEDYYKQQGEFTKQQQDYLKAKQAWEQGFMEQFGGAQEEFGAGMAEYQGQLAEASTKAQEVMGQYLAAAKPLLAQSQELLVPGVAALARGETPEAWQPLLNEARNRGVMAMVQSMVAAGMSPEEARAAAQPVAEQQAQTMLLQLATQMTGQGGELAKLGMGGLAGAGGLTEIMGKLAAMGMDAESQEFKIMASVLGSILGQPVQGTTAPTPPPPVG